MKTNKKRLQINHAEGQRMNSRVIVSASTALQYVASNEPHIAGRQAARRYRPAIRSLQRSGDNKPQTGLVGFYTLGNSRVSVNTGNRKRVLPIGHAPSPIVALRAHATRGNGYKVKSEETHKQRKPASPFSTILFIALKVDNVVQSAAKQPASSYRSHPNTQAKGIEEEIGH